MMFKYVGHVCLSLDTSLCALMHLCLFLLRHAKRPATSPLSTTAGRVNDLKCLASTARS